MYTYTPVVHGVARAEGAQLPAEAAPIVIIIIIIASISTDTITTVIISLVYLQ